MIELEHFVDRFQDADRKNHLIVFSCSCLVRYSGRAESFLGVGDRVVIIKPDKTLIIHQPAGSAPVNYMKENTSYSVREKDGRLIVKASNLAAKEFLEIEIGGIYFLYTGNQEDNAKIQLAGSEKDMADYIYNNPEVIELGFKPVSREEQTKFGFLDVFGQDKNNNLVIVECKRYAAAPTAVSQLRRYVERVKKDKGVEYIRGIIAAPKISPIAKKMLGDFGFEFREVQPPKYLEMFQKNQKKLLEF